MELVEVGIGQPIRSLQTFLRKISQYYNCITPVIPDGIYGTQTRNSVAEFQKAFFLDITGEVDNKTWDKIVEVYSTIYENTKEPNCVKIFPRAETNIGIGNTSEHLFVIQAMMKNLSDKFDNLSNVDITGVHDLNSTNSVKQLQIIAGMAPTGIIDRFFFDILTSMYDMHVSRNRLHR